MNRKAAGFTIIELIVVIALLGILSAVALPRFISVTDDAHTASVSGAGAGFATGVALFRAQSIAEGVASAAVDGFGDGTLWANGQGAPIASGSAASVNCVEVWEGLLQSNAPTVIQGTNDGSGSEDYYSSGGGTAACVYEYKTPSEAGKRTITYTASDRSVVVNADGEP